MAVLIPEPVEADAVPAVPQSPAAPLPRGQAFVLLAAMIALNMLNFIDRTLPQALVVDIVADLKLSYSEFAFMTGPMFGLVYAITGLAMGTLADRYSRTRLIAGGLFVWSAMTAAMGATHGFVQATAARAFVAVGEATLSPSALSMLAEAFPRERRGLVSALYYVGLSVGAGAAFLIAAMLEPRIGWRGCFLLLGGIGVAASALVLWLPDRRPAVTASPAQRQSFGQALRTFARLLADSAALRWTLFAAVLFLFGLSASLLDIAWLVAERGYDKASAAGTFGSLFILGSLAGVLLGGPLADWSEQRFGSRYPYFVAIALLVAPAAMLWRVLVPGSPAFPIVYLAAAAGQTLYFPAFVPLVQALAPTRLRATVIAAALLCMSLLGTALGAQAAGALADLFKRGGTPDPLSHALFWTNAVGLLAIPAALLGWRRYAADRARFGSFD